MRQNAVRTLLFEKVMKEARVLLADSHKLMLEGLSYLLRPTFEVVGLVSDTKSLLEVADTLKPDVAVVDAPTQGSEPWAKGDCSERL